MLEAAKLAPAVWFSETRLESFRSPKKMINMPSHKRGADQSRVIAKAPEPTFGSDRCAICRKEGEYWTIGYVNKAIRLRDLKGIGHLANLLRHPGMEFHALDLDLANGVPGQPPNSAFGNLRQSFEPESQHYKQADLRINGLGDAGEMLDEQAKNQYRRRLSDLRKELEEAKSLGIVERAERVEFEISGLTKELARAVGLKGRDRRAGSASERARQSLNKTIKAAIEKITELEPAIGGYLSRTIKTGTFCSYQPNPEFPINWDVGTEIKSETGHSDNGWTTARSNELPSRMLRFLPYSPPELAGFVGREGETGVIRAAIDRAANGCGSIIMVAGGPGIGKSRFAMTMRGYALRLGFQCSVGCCYEREEQLPYQPFVEIVEASIYQADSLDTYLRQVGQSGVELARLFPSLSSVFRDLPQPAEMEPAERRLYIFQSLTEMIGRLCQNTPQLYVLEDLHWADESTLTLLIHLAKRIAQLPVVILGTYRNIFSEHSRALLRTLEELIRLGVRTLRLGALPKSQVIQLLTDLSGRQPPEPLVNLLFEETQGNPFFLEQIYRQLLDEGKVFDDAGEFRSDTNIDEIEIPHDVLLVITRWLADLTEHEKQILAAAALVGRSFSLQVLSALSQRSLDELFSVMHKGQQMGILAASLQGSEIWYVFTNGLVRRTLLSYVSAYRYGSINSLCNQYDQAIELRYGQLTSRKNGGPPL
jgi:AAA ATPase domain